MPKQSNRINSSNPSDDQETVLKKKKNSEYPTATSFDFGDQSNLNLKYSPLNIFKTF